MGTAESQDTPKVEVVHLTPHCKQPVNRSPVEERGPHLGHLRLAQQTAGHPWGLVTWGTETWLLEAPTTEFITCSEACTAAEMYSGYNVHFFKK